MQDVPPGVELFSSHLNCRDISFFWATRGLCWSCYNDLVWFPTHLFHNHRHHHRYCHHKMFIVHPFKESYGGRWWGSKAQGWWKSISRLGWGLRTYWRVWDGEKLMHRSMKQGILLLFNMIIYGNNSCFFMGLYVMRSDRRYQLISISFLFLSSFEVSTNIRRNDVKCIVESLWTGNREWR